MSNPHLVARNTKSAHMCGGENLAGNFGTCANSARAASAHAGKEHSARIIAPPPREKFANGSGICV